MSFIDNGALSSGLAVQLLLLVTFSAWTTIVVCSEFPERECCEIISPLNPYQLSNTQSPITTAITASSTRLRPTNVKSTTTILNCLIARQFCFDDSSCSTILDIIPRVCGEELVACSTVMVSRCQAALRTLQAFPFFKPTCLCREPYADPECSTFRDFLFDHPCVFISKKDNDPYPMNLLPTCNHALTVCQQEQRCSQMYEDFKSNCKVRDNYCRVEDRILCQQAWVNMKRSPMFGCICPNNQMKKRCDRIYSIVNYNPCVAADNSYSSASYISQMNRIRVVYNPSLVDANNESIGSIKHHINVNVLLKNRGRSYQITASGHLHTSEVTDDIDKGRHETKHKQEYVRVRGTAVAETNASNNSISFEENTCTTAMDDCNKNRLCQKFLTPIIYRCQATVCDRRFCLESIRNFYRKSSLPQIMGIAFCICRETSEKYDPCLLVQEQLHPVCARKSILPYYPTCLNIIKHCRNNNDCKLRLEQYEQSCAVDSVTKKCAGFTADCRAALLGTLGTELRANCSCEGVDTIELNECLDWKRLLWINPCVVESQKDYHQKRNINYMTSRPTTIEIPKTTSSISLTVTVTSRTTIPSTETTALRTTTESSTSTLRTISRQWKPTLTTPQNDENVIDFDPSLTTTRSSLNLTKFHRRKTTTPETITAKSTPIYTTTKIQTTTSTSATLRELSKYCVVHKVNFPEQYIKEGAVKRIYHDDEYECSDICECHIGEMLSCKTICIDRMPCKTEFAFYNHAAPSYQALRGRCICYSGQFICMKPLMNGYQLPQGVFLFLGYSSVDEHAINRNRTRISIQDVVEALEFVIKVDGIKMTQCSLSLYNYTKDNMIITAKINKDQFNVDELSPHEIFNIEKEQCKDLLETISEKINTQNAEYVSNILLSIIKMSTVETVHIETSLAFSTSHTGLNTFCIFFGYLCLSKISAMLIKA